MVPWVGASPAPQRSEVFSRPHPIPQPSPGSAKRPPDATLGAENVWKSAVSPPRWRAGRVGPAGELWPVGTCPGIELFTERAAALLLGIRPTEGKVALSGALDLTSVMLTLHQSFFASNLRRSRFPTSGIQLTRVRL